jgi:hypothetical protein
MSCWKVEMFEGWKVRFDREQINRLYNLTTLKLYNVETFQL